MRVLIHGSEHPRHAQTFASVLRAFEAAGDEYLFLISNKKAETTDFTPKNWLSHKLRDICWDWFGYAKNRFVHTRWDWTSLDSKGEVRRSSGSPLEGFAGLHCPPLRCQLPWKPDVVLCVTPHEGHAKYQLIPWAGRQGIPVISIDHGAPLVYHDFGTYRSSMMGCAAIAVWGEESARMNASYGAPLGLQLVCGSPTLDDLVAVANADRIELRAGFGIDPCQRMVLLMTTHREPLKSHCDSHFRNLIEKYGADDSVCIVVKPHPVELLAGGLLELPDEVLVVDRQADLHRLIGAADVIVSPASSVIIPAMALKTLFVNLLHHSESFDDAQKYAELSQRLGSGILGPQSLDAAIRGEIEVDAAALAEAFTRFGHSNDGRNGERVAELCRWVARGEDAVEFNCSFDIIE